MLKELFSVSHGNIKFLLGFGKKKNIKMNPSFHYAFKCLLVPDLLCLRYLLAWNLY